jgi:hypothetical protein
MKKRLFLISISAIIIFYGCAPSSLQIKNEYHPVPDMKFEYKIIPKAEVSEEALEVMNERLKDQLSNSLHLDGDTSMPYQKIEILVTDYYMRHGAVRFAVGIFAGVDHILSKVTVRDASTDNSIAEFDVESKNPSAWGTSRGLIEDHIDQIVKYLKNGQT